MPYIPPGTILLIHHNNINKSKRPGLTTVNNLRQEEHYQETIYCTRSRKVALQWIRKTRKQQRNKAATCIQTMYRGMRDRKAMDAVALLYFPHDIRTPGGYMFGLKTCITIQRYWRGALARMHVLLALTRHAVSLVQGPARMLHAARKLQALSTAVEVICQQGNHQHSHLHGQQQQQQQQHGRERLTVHAAFRIAKAQDEASRTIQRAWRDALPRRRHHHRRSSLGCDATQYYNNKYCAWLGRSPNQFHFLLTALILTTNRKIFKLIYDENKFKEARQQANLKSNKAYIFDDNASASTTASANESSMVSDFSDILACLHA